MTVEILMHCFVAAAVEDQVMLVGVEASEGAEDAFALWTRLFVDAGLDGEVFHGLHAAGADLEDGKGIERGGCGDGLGGDGAHDFCRVVVVLWWAILKEYLSKEKYKKGVSLEARFERISGIM